MLRLVLLSVAALLASAAHADWALDNDNSAISFVSVKNGAVAEAQTFTHLQGTVTTAGQATVTISLDSVDTLVPVRDERMRTMLFDVAQYPRAVFTATVPVAEMQRLEVDEGVDYSLAGKLTVHGVSADLTIPVHVVRASSDAFLVASRKPAIVNAADFGLDKGIEALRAVAGLQGITPAVPVSFSVLFRQAGM